MQATLSSSGFQSRRSFYSSAKDCSLFAAIVALSRFAFRSHYLYDIDSVNFALALQRFDPAVHQPHPPGYFLYILLGRIANLATADANAAFVLISIASSCAAVIMIYLLARDWFGRGAAIAAALLFLFSPLTWFHGTVALTYASECFFSSLIGYLSWRVKEDGTHLIGLAIMLGVAAGFRPSSLLFLGPLCIYAVWTSRGVGSRRRRVLVSGATLIAVLLCWFVPMIYLSGGPHRYFDSLQALWMMVPAKNTLLTSPIAFCLARLLLIGVIGCLCFGTGLAFACRKSGAHRQADRERARFIWFWIAPGLLFFTFVFLLFVNSGYLLLLSPPLFVYLGRNAFAWFKAWENSPRWRNAILFAAAAANTAFFVFGPVYCSYRSVRQFETQLVSLTAAVHRNVSPTTTMLIGFDSHFLGYRHAAYYLPEYLTVQFPELKLAGAPGAFGARNRQTEVLRTLPRNQFAGFVVLPLPPDDEDRVFLKRAYGRFPSGELKETHDGEWLLGAGSVTDLQYLFGHL